MQAEPDLTAASEVEEYFERVGRSTCSTRRAARGEWANMRFPADLMRDNLLAGAHLVDAAHRHGVTKLLYLASSCSYPKHCANPCGSRTC